MDHHRLPGGRADLHRPGDVERSRGVVFGIGALTWLLASMYRRSVGGDVFGDNDRGP
jgi:hypothetical protein